MKDASKDAFALLIAPHVDALYRASYRLTGNRPDAEDLFQEVCLRAYANLTEIGRVDQPKACLLKVQYRLFVDGLRRRKRSPLRSMPEDPDAPALTSRDPGPDALVEGALTARRLRDALRRNQPALVMPLLRPRVREQHEDAGDGLIGEPGEHVPRITNMDADRSEPCALDLAEQARHAVDKGLTADEADMRMMSGLPDEVLAGPKTDLEPDFGNRAREQPG